MMKWHPDDDGVPPSAEELAADPFQGDNWYLDADHSDEYLALVSWVG